jgi:D-alanyl-D-alanine carboxypeptidase (penicillin-binding protein 5/6)
MRDKHGATRGQGSWTFAAIGILLAVAIGAFWWPGSSGSAGTTRHRVIDGVHIAWPVDGESALAINGGTMRFSRPANQPIPIASVAKVMTAYLVLQRYPMPTNTNGFTVTLTDADAAQAAQDSAEGQSFVPVATGEVLTERDALEALLLPSANNIAMTLAAYASGSVPGFVAAMNHEAAVLKMRHTTYTDPSGYDDLTVSTARDQLRLARVAFRNATLRSIAALPEATIPVAGLVHNTDTLLGRDGFVGGKTGSDTAAGGCFMFVAHRQVGARSFTYLGVVLGQRGDDLITSGLLAADDLVASVNAKLSRHLGHHRQ